MSIYYVTIQSSQPDDDITVVGCITYYRRIGVEADSMRGAIAEALDRFAVEVLGGWPTLGKADNLTLKIMRSDGQPDAAPVSWPAEQGQQHG